MDRQLCSNEFLSRLLIDTPDSLGLVLQLEEAPGDKMALTNIFPAFQAALSEASKWPGMLIWNEWTPEGSFIPFRNNTPESIQEEASWIIQTLSTTGVSRFSNLKQVSELHKLAFPRVQSEARQLHILQLSDIHLGCDEADSRLLLIQQHIANLVSELKSGIVVPVVSGDLMDSPTERNLAQVRLFFAFLNSLNIEQPLSVLGNHDVRKDGWLQRLLGKALQLPTTHGLHWYDEANVGIACFNSVVEGRLARGFIGERQRVSMSAEIEGRPDRRNFAIVAVLHHHPLPVETPEWFERAVLCETHGRGI